MACFVHSLREPKKNDILTRVERITMRAAANSCRPMVELLEDRAVPDGRVWAAVVHGNLIVRGDRLANSVIIDREGADPGEIRVMVDNNTTLNNGDGFFAFFSGVTKDIRIQLGGGDDKAIVRGLSAPHNLSFSAGRGDDRLLLDSVAVGRHFIAMTGAGDDVVAVIDSSVAGNTRVFTGLGNDIVSLDDSAFENVTVASSRGNDTIYLGSTISGRRYISDGPGRDVVTSDAAALSFDFRNGALGWEAGFADYPAGEEEFYELEAGLRPLPPELGAGTGFFITGNNHSDDLFMFLKRRLGPEDGIVAGRTYLVRMTITFGSNVPTGCFGIGGSPGESVALKAGAVATEPIAVLDPSDGHLRMNVDKVGLGKGPLAASPVSTIGNGTPCDEAPPESPYVSLKRAHIHEVMVTANDGGEIWLLIGTDSGFESTTALYYQQVDVKLVPVG